MDKMNLSNSSSTKVTKYKVENDAYIQQSFLDLNISDDAKRKLSLILNKTTVGSSEVFTSPYVKEKTPEQILSGLDDVYFSGLDKCNQPLQDLEMLNRSKFGPMSIAKTWKERRESLYDSYNTPASDRTFKPFALCKPETLRPISVPNAIGYLKNDTNSGLPDVTKKKNVKDVYLSYTINDIFTIIDSHLTFGKYAQELACILFTRTQENGKTRNVWGFAIIVTIFEMLFYRPILEIQSKQPWRAALNRPEDVSRSITTLIDRCINKGWLILSIDFSRYDNSVKEPLIISAFTCISMCFQRTFLKYIVCIREFFINCEIITPDGIINGSHGVPSGSTFTNEVDSIVQRGVSLECQYIADHSITQVQGDDGVYASFDPKKVMGHFTQYGLIVNEDKSYIAKDWCVYLQSLFHVDYRKDDGVIYGIYPIYRAMNRIIYLERFDDFKEFGIAGSDYFSIRTISIMEQCKHHPLFNVFVTYVWSLDQYRLKYSEQGLANYVRKLAFQEGKDINFRNWNYGSNTTGIRNFESVKIINKLNESFV